MTAYKINGRAEVSAHYDKDLEVRGDISTDEDLTVDGRLLINGKFYGHRVNAQAIEMKGTIAADSIKANQLQSKGDLSCEKLEVGGYLQLEGVVQLKSAEADQIHFQGRIRGNFLKAKEVQILLDGGESKMDSIQADSVLISAKDERSTITVNTIEGKSLTVSQSKVDQVTGEDVHIGSGCEINHVSYIRHLDISPGSIVRSQTQL